MVTKKYILGINSAYHESSACLIGNGEIIAVAEEERFNRVKHGKPARVDNPNDLPLDAINFCLDKAGISLKEVDYIGYSLNPKKRLQNKDFSEEVVEGSWGSDSGEKLFNEKVLEIPKILSELAKEDISDKFIWVDHHLAHAASAFFVSPYDEAAILVIDGIGEIESTTLYKGKDNKIFELYRLDYPNSLGFLWEKISKFLGFSEYDAAKVMGLASYGNPFKYYKRFRKFVEINEKDFQMDNNILKFRVEDYTELEKILGKRRNKNDEIGEKHVDIAAALQKITEEILLKLTNHLYEKTKVKNLCIAGGVGLNCTANKVLQEKGKFDSLYIQPAANDAGTAIGSAYYIWNQILDNKRSYVMDDAFLGTEYSNEEIKNALVKNNLDYVHYEDIEKVVAKLVSEGNIVGWFQGRMEVAPRALGNRTLLADPRNPSIRNVLNMKVKHREYFRPFAPSVLADKASEWFSIPNNSLSSDFMLFAYDVLGDKKKLIPAVIHVDGTSRIQTVKKNSNPKYYALIKEFEKITGVPLVLNTSFNDREPIVCSPQDAINTFLKTKIDHLVIGNYLVSRGFENGN